MGPRPRAATPDVCDVTRSGPQSAAPARDHVGQPRRLAEQREWQPLLDESAVAEPPGRQPEFRVVAE
ncbi:MAG: hypothetical protein M3302_00485 [Actinomycetota bacterium]|nr:hypothetical protein [Actinomycetota bacterium]